MKLVVSGYIGHPQGKPHPSLDRKSDNLKLGEYAEMAPSSTLTLHVVFVMLWDMHTTKKLFVLFGLEP